MANRSNILFASDNEMWAEHAEKHFNAAGYAVTSVKNGQAAQIFISKNEVFAIVIDLNLRNHSSIQLIKFLKISKPSVIVLLLIFPEAVLEGYKVATKDIIKLGVNDVIQAPNDFDKIQSKLEGYQSITQIMAQIEFRETNSPEMEIINNYKNFTAIPIDEFYSIRFMLFDVYIKIGDQKFIKILHAGESFDRKAIDRYKSRNAKELHILNKDRNRYISFCNTMAKKLIKNDKVKSKEKVYLTKNALTKFLEEFEDRDILESTMGQSKQVISSVLSLVEFDAGLSHYLRQYFEMDPNHYTHTFLVTLIACNIIQQLEWDSNLARETFAMAALFHDLGVIGLDPSIKNKKLNQLSPEELEQYKQHPVKAVEMLNKCSLIHPTVIQIILNHHERRDGSGYPLGILGHKIHPMAEILSFAEFFVEYISEKKFTPAIGFAYLLQTTPLDHLFDTKIIKALGGTFIKKDNRNKGA